mmetsp:Transcript_102030/g.329109  ORF Transcript_102030/g.329109 Transcript_102030/m.329109 type:complete len:228 (+) Transcript_102030:236-919(+)
MTNGSINGQPYIVDKEGWPFCLLCQQWADHPHLGSKKHTKRLAEPEYYLWEEGTPDPLHSPMPRPPLQLGQGQGLGQPPLAAGRKCTWCGEPAVERDADGSKARYCAVCWDWWLAKNGPGIFGDSPPPPPPPRPGVGAGLGALITGASPSSSSSSPARGPSAPGGTAACGQRPPWSPDVTRARPATGSAASTASSRSNPNDGLHARAGLQILDDECERTKDSVMVEI